MHRDPASSHRPLHGLAQRRSRATRIARLFFIVALLISGFAGMVPVSGPSFVEQAEAHHTNIKLPVPAGQSWTASQGYNTNPASGGSHYNCDPATLRDEPSSTRICSQYWQYKYSFDLVPSDGSSAAGHTVLSPVNGVIRWIDEAYGGMSIDLGDGYAYAYFHTVLAPGLAAGQTVTQGQYLGTVAPPGQGGNGGFPHIHVTLWQTNDGGNWSRNPVPFVGSQAIEGVSLAAMADSSVNQHRGSTFTSTNVGLATESLPPSAPVHQSPSHGFTYDATSQVVTFTWLPSEGATEYQVWINNSPVTGWITATSWTSPALGTGQHAWQLKARGPGGEGSLSGKWVLWIDPSGGDDLPPLSNEPGSLGVTSDPTNASPGRQVVVTGAGMQPNETVRIYWDSASGSPLGTTVANGAGNWRIIFALPDATGGTHQILARGASSNRNAGATFTVNSALERTPISGVPGTSISVKVRGFGSNENVSLTFMHSSTSQHALGSVRTDANGTGTTTVTLPSSTVGQHDYRGTGQSSGRTAWGALWIQTSISLSADQGASGDTVTATVRGLPGSASARVAWNQSGSSNGTTLCNGTTSSTGTLTCTFTVPTVSAGAYPIVATAGSTSISATFGIAGTAAITITPSSGKVASQFQISLGGYQANELVRLTFDGSSTVWREVRVASNGTALVKTTIPFLTQGSHSLQARGVSSGRTSTGTLSISPSMELNQSGGAPGSSASAWMRGFAADTSITLRFNSTNGTNGTSVCTGRTNSEGTFNCTFTVPQISASTYPVRAVSNGLSATSNFAVTTAGEIVGGAVIGIGTYQVTATREGLVGGTTSNGHVIVPNDHFVALPACTPSNCPWLQGGTTSPTLGYITDCGDACFVRVTNPATGICRVEPIWDTGPWSTNDNWWAPTEMRTLNNRPQAVNILPQGYPASDAARDGLDIGYGLSNGYGITNVGHETGNRAAIDIADGTWQDIGFEYAAGIGTVIVSMLWQTGEDVETARQACFDTSSEEEPGDPRVTISSLSGHAGDAVTVSGTGYGSGERVDIFWDTTRSGSPIANATASSNGAFSVVVTIPSAEPGTHLLVGKGARTSGQASRSYLVLPPTRVYLDPYDGAIGSTISVTGSGFHRGETVEIYWDSTGSTGQLLTTTTATNDGEFSANVNVPNADAGGHYVVGLGRSSGLKASRTFTVSEGTSGPSAPDISISHTTVYVGAEITVSGAGYGANESVQIYWDSTFSSGILLKTVTANGSGEFSTTITIPDDTDGKHLVVGRGVQSGLKPSRSLTIQSAPIISSDPETGAPGATATISGANFVAQESVQIFWNSTTSTALSTAAANPDGSFSIGIAVPASASTGEHTVIARGVTSGFEARLDFTVTAPPTTSITFDPMSGPVGTSVTITGSNFASGEQVVIRWDNTSSGANLGSVTANSSGSFTVTVTVPETSVGPHRLIAHAQTTNKKPFHDFEVTAPAATSISFDPMSGPVGTAVTVTGSNFEPGEQVNLRWDNTSSGANLGSVNASSNGSFTTTITVPDSSAGPHRLIAHAQTTNKKPFHDFEVTVSTTTTVSFTPMTGPPGTSVTVTGSNFESGEQVVMRWNNTSSGPNLGTVNANANGDFTITVTVPDAAEGPHRLIAHAQTTNKKPFHDFEVTEPVIIDPRIDIDQTQGRTGTVVTVTGTDYMPGETVEIRWNSSSSSAPLLATATASASGTFTANVTIPNVVGGRYYIVGKGLGSGENPTRSFSVTPSTGGSTTEVEPGDELRLTMRGFQAGERIEIYFDSVTGTPLSTVTANSIGVAAATVVIPDAVNGAHGVIAVGGATSAPAFVVNVTSGSNEPAEADFESSNATPGDRVTINLANFWSGERVEVFWNSNSSPTSSLVIGANGSLAGTITVPTLPAGSHTVTVKGVDSGKEATTSISLGPVVVLTPPIGAVDANIRVDVKGSNPGSAVSVYFNRPAGGSGGTLACSATARDSGTASCSFNVPSGFAVGTVVPITATGSAGSATALFEVRNPPVGFYEPAAETDASTDTESDASATPEADESGPIEETPLPDEETPVVDEEAPVETPVVDEEAPVETPVVEEPTPAPAPEPRTVVVTAVSDVTVFGARPDDAGTEEFGVLTAGGDEAAVSYVTFSVEGIGAGTIIDARLVLTGAGSVGGNEVVSIVPGLWIDETSATWNGLPTSGLTPSTNAGWTPVYLPSVGGGETVWIDVTTSISGDGVITFVITGNPGAISSFLSRESGNGPRLEITVQD